MRGHGLAVWILGLAVAASGACKLSTDGAGDVSLGGSGGAAGGGGEAGSGGASICTPGEQTACACPSGGSGLQECAADGSGFGACLSCPEPDGGGTGGTGGSAGAAGTGGQAGTGGIDASAGSDGGDAAVDVDTDVPFVCPPPGFTGYCVDPLAYLFSCVSLCPDTTFGTVCSPACVCVPLPPECTGDGGAPDGSTSDADADASAEGGDGSTTGDAPDDVPASSDADAAGTVDASSDATVVPDAPAGIPCCPSTVCPGFGFCSNGTCSASPLGGCDPAQCTQFCTQCPDNKPEAGSWTGGTCSVAFGIFSCDCF